MVSNPRAADVIYSGWANNYYAFNIGPQFLPLDYICTSTDGDANCGIPAAYTCELRNENCDVGTSPQLYSGMTTTPTV